MDTPIKTEYVPGYDPDDIWDETRMPFVYRARNNTLYYSDLGAYHYPILQSINARADHANQLGSNENYLAGDVTNGDLFTYGGSAQAPAEVWDKAKELHEFLTKKRQSNRRIASLPYKFVYADGQLGIGPGWRKDIHHMHIMQDMGITEMPTNMIAGDYNEDNFTGQPSIRPVWGPTGNVPTDDELAGMIRQQLNPPQHPGRVSRKPW